MARARDREPTPSLRHLEPLPAQLLPNPARVLASRRSLVGILPAAAPPSRPHKESAAMSIGKIIVRIIQVYVALMIIKPGDQELTITVSYSRHLP
jgi:hypothetical protein